MTDIESLRKPQTIILFSAGQVSGKEGFVKNPNIQKIKDYFPKEYCCYTWKELFSNAKDQKNVALLPMLVKKIPTFDFALILADGVDKATVHGEENTIVMRDNVLFECGLCIMALGTKRVILLVEENVRIPDDLLGIKGMLAINKIEFKKEKEGVEGNIHSKLGEVIDHINKEAGNISPVVIGAAISTADGYLSNFILRFWENIGKGFTDIDTQKTIKPEPSEISMKILIPNIIDDSVKEKADNYYNTHGFSKGRISDGGIRGVDFRYKQTNDQFEVIDIPSTLTASYNTVEDILNLNAEEIQINENSDSKESKINSKERFLMKERDSFKFTLNKLMTTDALTRKLKNFGTYNNPENGEKKLEEMLQFLKNQVSIGKIQKNEF